MNDGNPILEMSFSSAVDATTAAILMSKRREYDLASQFWHEPRVSARMIGQQKLNSVQSCWQ
jgi:hypothetical protein